MADLFRTSYVNDWDLEAIIRGWSGGGSDDMAVEEVTWQPTPVGFEFEGIEEFEATATVLNKLEELYKPFLLRQEQPVKACNSYSPEGPTSTKTSSSSPAILDGCDGGSTGGVEKPEEQEVMRPEVVEDHKPTRVSCKPRYMKKKQKQKTRVVHVGVAVGDYNKEVDDDENNNVSKMDQWNWRKYGQKSIKGSPYPRSYYKCSSLGGCKARKQVEQSKEHPYTLVVTYIGDHVHPIPAKRRSLAGRTLTGSILHQPPCTS